MILGIAYHSPLDILALFPVHITYSMSPKDDVDVFISESIVREYNARIQFVFTSARDLFKQNLPTIDHAAWGKIIPLTGEMIEEILNKKSYSTVPEWAKF